MMPELILYQFDRANMVNNINRFLAVASNHAINQWWLANKGTSKSEKS
jgi:hypothetical protein